MQILLDGDPKEIAALVVALQEQPMIGWDIGREDFLALAKVLLTKSGTAKEAQGE